MLTRSAGGYRRGLGVKRISGSDPRLCRRDERQAHLEPGVARARLEPQVTVVLVDDDPPGDVEPQPGALAERLGGEERLEDAVPDLFGDTGAGVADLDEQVRPRPGPCARSACPCPSMAPDRVVDQVGPHLVELGGVGRHRRQASGRSP